MGASGLSDSGSVVGACMKPDFGRPSGSPLFLSDDQRYLAVMEKDNSQLDFFKEAARQLEADDDEDRFNEKLKKLAKKTQDEGKNDTMS